MALSPEAIIEASSTSMAAAQEAAFYTPLTDKVSGVAASGIETAADWVRENPVGGTIAVATGVVAMGYLAYKVFVGGKE